MKNFLKKYWSVILAAAIILTSLICTYLCFTTTSSFPTGESLEKSDWLAFWGGYLSFAGSLILGTIAIWQNDRANEVNKKAIEENRRQSEIEFEHELKKNEYTRIADGVRELHCRIFNIVQTLNSTQKRENPNIDKAFLDSVIIDIGYLRCMEIDSILPPCYYEKYPILKSGKEQLKQVLEGYEQEIKKSIENVEAGNTKYYYVNLKIPDDMLLNLSSFFHNKLNDIQSYRSFVKEDAPDGQ